ncbi:MAG TPA: carboxylesterase family protein, partial [Caulobacteraceae bacterium]|nr:carboxylesterase family protein [Caulobacteraceae bacterium]
AAPPVGARRFRPPQPPAPWSEPLDAANFGAAPMQAEAPVMKIPGPRSEDCLTLNVWAPREGGPYPVLFSIYGGGNVVGAASHALYDGTRFARQGLVYVNANYRLGAFGFLELGGLDPAYAGSGLNGLRDLIAALKWVKDNVAAFGGDPAKVAIMGQSAGAKNVCALATMPGARGLFQRAGVQSGGGHTVFGSPDEATPVAQAVLAAAGLSSRDVAGLAALPAEALISAQGRVMQDYPKGHPFRPTVDGADMPLRPIDATRAGATRDLDLVIGTTRDENALVDAPSKAQGPFRPAQLSHASLESMQALEPRYANLAPALSITDRHIRQLTAEAYWVQAVRFAEAHATAGGRAHMYRFDIAVADGPFAGYATHAADLPFIYGSLGHLPMLEPPVEAMPDISRIHAFWANWAKTGDLIVADAPTWPPYDADKRRTFIFDHTPRIEEDPRGEERRLWNGVTFGGPVDAVRASQITRS